MNYRKATKVSYTQYRTGKPAKQFLYDRAMIVVNRKYKKYGERSKRPILDL